MELNHAPSSPVPYHVLIHTIACAPATRAGPLSPAAPGSPSAPKRRRSPATAPSAAAGRLLESGGATGAAPLVETVSLRAPQTVFLTANASGSLLASFASRSIPAAADPDAGRFWLIVAPEAFAIGTPGASARARARASPRLRALRHC